MVPLGSGVRNLIKYVKIYSGKEPSFFENDIFKMIIPLKETTRESSEKILRLISENNFITIEELSKIVNLTTRAIEKNISKLKEMNLIKRIGSDKSGHWEIIKENKKN